MKNMYQRSNKKCLLHKHETNPISYCRQQASRKSVTGLNSAYTGLPPNQRLFRSETAFSASSSRRNCENKNYLYHP